MRRLILLSILLPALAVARPRILVPNCKSLQVFVNDEWLALPIMQLGTDDVLTVSFDELSHDYHRYIYEIEPCNPDWTPTDGLFESDWLDGFNRMPINDYENSLNTTVLYTHFQLTLPNDDTRLKMSGNYRLHIIDEDNDEEALCVEFCVVEPLMGVTLGVTTNTDVDLNQRHQQLSMNVTYNSLRVTNPSEQVQTVVMQNGREDNMKRNATPTFVTQRGLAWEHHRGLIFEAGNEYHKFEVLDPSHTTMGLAWVMWDEDQRQYHVYPYPAEPRRSYIYDQDADGAYIIRNSDNVDIDITSDYVYVHYIMKPWRQYTDALVRVDGRWTIESPSTYDMHWNEDEQLYECVVLQKMGYYNYQLLLVDYDGTTHLMPEEGSFYQTENRYDALVYFCGTGERSWRLVGHAETTFRP